MILPSQSVAVIIVCLLALIYLRFLQNTEREYQWDQREIEKLDLKPGDFIVTWGSGFIGWLIQALIFLKDGVRKAPTHNMHVHSAGPGGLEIASAEPLGYRIIEGWKRLKKTRHFTVFRFKNITPEQLTSLQRRTIHFTSKGYDYFLYVIHALRVSLVTVPAMFYMYRDDPIQAGALFLALVVLYFPVMWLLKKAERATVACSEAETLLYRDEAVGLFATKGIARNVAPHNNFNILLNLAQHGAVEIVYSSKHPDYRPGEEVQ